MTAKKLIIHVDNCSDIDTALARARHGVRLYYETRSPSDERLTIRFEGVGGEAMIIYHNLKDAIIVA